MLFGFIEGCIVISDFVVVLVIRFWCFWIVLYIVSTVTIGVECRVCECTSFSHVKFWGRWKWKCFEDYGSNVDEN